MGIYYLKCNIVKSLLCLISSRTRFRSWRNGAVLGSKRPRQGLPFLNGSAQIVQRLGFCGIIYVSIEDRGSWKMREGIDSKIWVRF